MSIIDFFWERQQRYNPQSRSPPGELALHEFDEMLMRRDWLGFGYWLGVYRSATAALPSDSAFAVEFRLNQFRDASILLDLPGGIVCGHLA
jgi:hypothetical protein